MSRTASYHDSPGGGRNGAKRRAEEVVNMKPQDRIDHRYISLIIIYFCISLMLLKLLLITISPKCNDYLL